MKQPLYIRIASRFLSAAVALLVAPAGLDSRTQTVPKTSAAGPKAKTSPVFDESNPFAKPSPLPFQAPPFDKIKDTDYQPAIEEGMRQELADVELIAKNPKSPTFANTIEALERRGEMLRRVLPVFFGMASSNKDPLIQKVQAEEAPKLAAHRDVIYLNPKLFARVKAVYDQQATLKLATDAEYLLERYYHDFVRAGALLSDGDRDTMRALNNEQSQLSDQFRHKVLADSNASALCPKLTSLPQPKRRTS